MVPTIARDFNFWRIDNRFLIYTTFSPAYAHARPPQSRTGTDGADPVAMTARLRRHALLVAAIVAAFAIPPATAHAADGSTGLGTLLIQPAGDGTFRTWEAAGDSELSENELLILEGTATPAGGPPLRTRFGPARAFETQGGIVVELPQASRDKVLLLDHDACSAIKAWHGAGATGLTDDQLADIYLSATPDGGRNLMVGERMAKAFATKLGVKAIFWTPLKKRN
ncbi:hypothetical protein [Sulfurisoma sediminicola]|uniref:Uncharacterized protein n=1 Tax=Sulfurisoma sediminicola TaxID=1381557 RepID=A0A497XM87_9PROT|nr:hypothetical protein [Sulfurisoma sediminicola]RLJ67638.1 hypothetical protein DFR35_0187 [Sulfurisoma sediminicola]